MTLHWWMHWFWITRLSAAIVLLLVCSCPAAPLHATTYPQVFTTVPADESTTLIPELSSSTRSVVLELGSGSWNSQGLDKPAVNLPGLITRDLASHHPPPIAMETESPPPDLQGPSDQHVALTGESAINSRGETDAGESDSRTIWINRDTPSVLKHEKNNPSEEPVSSTVVVPKTRPMGEAPVPSDDFVGSTTGKSSVNVTRSGLPPPVVMTSEGSVEHNLTVDSEENVTQTPDGDEDDTTGEPTVVPVSNRVQAAAPPGSHHGLDTASITGISLGIVVFAALVGAVSFVLYRRRFLNKPQTLNDKCSNPDSSGYIDDSTLRENSEEMYSLDNDSFLNSLEAMTIQNYWTDNVKHTKL